jgi:hypothetical protein
MNAPSNFRIAIKRSQSETVKLLLTNGTDEQASLCLQHERRVLYLQILDFLAMTLTGAPSTPVTVTPTRMARRQNSQNIDSRVVSSSILLLVRLLL